MGTGRCEVVEILLEDGYRRLRLVCSPRLVPGPGQYLLASSDSDSPLPVPLLYTESTPSGFIASVPESTRWGPGSHLHLRGPLGRGFLLPSSARRVGLIALEAASASSLHGLVGPALKQEAAVVLVCPSHPENLPDDVEVQPLSALPEIMGWADYLAFDIRRENLDQFRQRAGMFNQLVSRTNTQALLRTPMPCGGLAECGVCAVSVKHGWKLACKDGPVFDWTEIA